MNKYSQIKFIEYSVERYNFKKIEEKWQTYWEKNNFFKSKIDKDKKKILLSRNVSLPLG